MPVVLINVFEVQEDKADAFIALWRRTAAAVKQQPGFIDAKLHRAEKADAKFQFVNVAHWESEETYHAAFRRVRVQDEIPDVKATPALYKVINEY